MKIEVEIKSKHGINLFYPVCDKAKAFAAIACNITLTDYTINLIKRLGYEIIIINEKK